MANNNNIITRSSSEDATVTHFMLNVADHRTFRDRSERQNISHHKSSFLPAVNELPSIHPFSGDEQLLLVLVAEGVAESDLG